MRNILLLTATVTPPEGVPFLARTDPAQRLQDYAQALQFYLQLPGSTFDSIVFAENSASDISSLRKIVDDARAQWRVELLSFSGLDHPPSYGRGYGEFKLVDHAMRHSQFLQDDAYVWKCTGRYVVMNIATLVKRRPATDIYCHLRNYPHRLCDLSLISFNRNGHESAIKDTYKLLRNDIVPGVHSNEEIAFRKLVDALPPHVTIARRFNSTPVIRGIRGWNNSSYSSEWEPKIIVRRVAQAIAPWLWI